MTKISFSAKISTVLPGTSTSEQTVSKGAVGVSELSSPSDDGVSVSEYCAEMLRFFGEKELQTLVAVAEESIAEIFGGLCGSGAAAAVFGVSRDIKSSTLLMQGVLTRQESFRVGIPPVESPVKPAANVTFIVDESSEELVGAARLMKVTRSDFGRGDKTVTSIGGVSTDFELSETDAMVSQSSAAGQAETSRVPVGFARVDIPPLEELTARQRFSQRSWFYPSQSARTLLNDFFE